LALDHQLLSYQQTAEWGMWDLQGWIGCLRVPLTIDYDTQLLLLHVVTCAYNMQTRCVGLKEIWAVYCDIWHGAEGDAIWDGFASMMFGELRRNHKVVQFHIATVEQD